MEKENVKNYEQLAADIVYAMQCGKDVENSYESDDGTCNLDFCVISLPGWRIDSLRKAVQKANENTGLRIFMYRHGTKGRFAITPDTHCQGYPRTANAEKIAQVLSDKGWNCSVYYLMD